MKITKKNLVCLILMGFVLSGIEAAVTWEPYLSFSKGKAKIEEERVPFLGLSLGTTLGTRATVELFLMGQSLSELPQNPCEATVSKAENPFAIVAGIQASLAFFKDATLNPMVQASIGQMILISAESIEDTKEFTWFFFSSIATGLELDIFDSCKVLILSGYRFAPHDQVMCIESNTLTSKFSSISFRIHLD